MAHVSRAHELSRSHARVHSASVARRAPTEVAVAVWRLSRPAIWLVSVLPLWTGHLLATRELVPTTVSDGWRFGLAVVVMGPLGWAAASAINDIHDLFADRRNPRKVDAPLVRGALSPAAVRAAAYASAALALATALAVGAGFALLTGAVLALAWAYSVPPLRLKTRPGADVASNAVAVGVLPLLAGWVVARPLVEFPWWFVPQGVAVAVALYVPTTLVDLDADRVAGQRTVATRLGRRAAYRVGSGAWGLGAAGTLVLAATDTVIPRSLLRLFAVFLPVLVVEYHLLIGRAATSVAMVRGIVVLSLTFLVPSAAFALVYTGLWQP
jgi:lycopene elongase/hydratase (dihydrobisanhydrobacterioruberin-forming)